MVLITWNSWSLAAGLALILIGLCVISSDLSPASPDKLSEYSVHGPDSAVCAQLPIRDRVKLGTMQRFSCAGRPLTRLNAVINGVCRRGGHRQHALRRLMDYAALLAEKHA